MNVLYFVYCFAILNSKSIFSNANPLMGYNIEYVEARELDFIVSISKKYHPGSYEEDSHICGGVLITTRHVITSAHCKCERAVELDYYTVKIGHDLRNPKANYSIESWINFKKCCCPLFKRQNICNDIAVLRLSEDIRSKLTREIEFPVLNYSPIDQFYHKTVLTAGWGIVNSLVHPRMMQKTVMRTITKEECQRNIDNAPKVPNSNGRTRERYIVKSHVLCSNGNPIPGRIPYTSLGSGDSGSPLIFRNNQIIAINQASVPVEGAPYVAYEQTVHVVLKPYRRFIENQLAERRNGGCFGTN
ncbi:kallikrein-7-like [Phymastichus coffea]|uniref:kallikrein-7-like n=1 Tax=Phymastichus coffea TaxID=108790 RepID=UPI00273CC93D|nr:kallikrein-7-like [Phymastichus coffea]